MSFYEVNGLSECHWSINSAILGMSLASDYISVGDFELLRPETPREWCHFLSAAAGTDF